MQNFFCKLLLASGFTHMDNNNKFIEVGTQEVTKSLRVNYPFLSKNLVAVTKIWSLKFDKLV